MTAFVGTGQDQISTNGMLGKAAFLNQDVPVSGPLQTIQTAPTIASATTIAPTARISFVSGTTAIATITVPTNLLTTGGQITLIPKDNPTFTTTIAGNIALATNAVQYKVLIMTYDATTTKWYPSY